MTLRPHDVSKPHLMDDIAPKVVDFAHEKFAALARRTIARMQGVDASGIFEGRAQGQRSLGDKWCWYQAHHDNGTALLSDAVQQVLSGWVELVVGELPRTEARLLTRAVAESPDEANGYSPTLIGKVLKEVISEAASRRDLSRFEVC